MEHFGHDVEHVDFVGALGKGATDLAIAQYSLDTDRVIVTYDDDFVLEVPESSYRATLYVSDATLSIPQVADVVHNVSEYYPGEDLTGLVYVGSAWL